MKGTRKDLEERPFHGEFRVNPIMGDYCFRGKLITLTYGPASQKFSHHVADCRQCEIALEMERPQPKN